MGFNEVNELRKSGQLREAYEMASRDIEQNPQDPWSHRAMFWVLYDMAQAEHDAGNVDQAMLMADAMAELIPAMQEQGEPLAANSLEYLRQSLLPYYREVSHAIELALSGNPTDAYTLIEPMLISRSLDEKLHERAGWVIWHVIFRCGQQMPLQALNAVLSAYFTLTGIKRPSQLHSRILHSTLIATKRHPDFDILNFLNHWGYDSFADEDFQPVAMANKQYPSIAEQAVMRYISKQRAQRVLEYPDEVVGLLEKIVKANPDNLSLHRYLSLSHFERGNKERSLELHRKLAARCNRFFVWHELANMLTHDLTLRTSALCQALLSEKQQRFLSDIHRELSWELIREQNYPAALLELQTFNKIRKENHWPPSWRYKQMLDRIPGETIPADDNTRLYEQYAEHIIDWVYQDIEPTPVIVAGTFTDKRGNHLAKIIAPDQRSTVVPIKQLHLGQKCYTARLIEEANGRLRAMTLQPADPDEVIPQFDVVVSGNVRIFNGRDGRTYGFLDQCFISGQLLEGVNNEDYISVITEPQPDGRRRAVARI